MTTVITNIDCQERTGRNGNSYLNAFVTIASPVKGAQSMPDGTHRMGMLGAIQMPFNQILLVMRKDKFYGRFVNYVGEAAEAGFASMYLTGVAVKVLCQFVPAGVQDRNPFTRKDNLYNVVDYDRYVYHIVGIEQPVDPVLVGAYNVLIKQIMEDARAAIAAKREAKAKAASFRATGGGGYYLEGDRWGMIDPVASSIPWYKPVDGERVVAFFNPLADTDKGAQVKIEGIQEVLTKRGGRYDG